MVRKDERDRRHAAGLNYKQQTPAVEKGNQRMHRFANVDVLPAGLGDLRREFGVDEPAG